VEDGRGIAKQGRFEFDHGLFDEFFFGIGHGLLRVARRIREWNARRSGVLRRI
jgi:hypothetical protein